MKNERNKSNFKKTDMPLKLIKPILDGIHNIKKSKGKEKRYQ